MHPLDREYSPEAGAERLPGPSTPLPVTLAALLGWIGEHVRGFHAALGVFLTLGMALALAALLLFVGIAALAAGGLTYSVDREILLWLNRQANPALDAAALEITALGSGYVTSVVLIVASLFLWATRHRYSAALLWMAVLGGWLLNSVLTLLFARPTPDLFELRVPNPGASAYPSGHSMTAMVLYATLAYLVIRLEPTRTLRRLTVAVFGVVILLVGLSRLYLGVHYPSDVLGGFLVGFAWATFCALGIEAIRYFRARRPELAREEQDLDRGVLPRRWQPPREPPAVRPPFGGTAADAGSPVRRG